MSKLQGLWPFGIRSGIGIDEMTGFDQTCLDASADVTGVPATNRIHPRGPGVSRPFSLVFSARN
jgi:hypothetical protein